MVSKKTKIKIFKLSIVLVFAVLLYVFNGGPTAEGFAKIQSLIFPAALFMGVISRKLRTILIALGLVLIVTMIPFYIFLEEIKIADNIGSTGFGFLLIGVILYLPALLEGGEIKEIKKWIRV